MVKNRAKIEIILLIWITATAVWNYVSGFTKIENLSTYSYTALLVFWLITVGREIKNPYIRRRLQAGGVFFILLFILRLVRWNIPDEYVILSRYCWYGYYIPTIVTPLLSLSLSLCIGNRDEKMQNKVLLPFRVFCAVLIGAVLTNDLHGTVLHIWEEDGKVHSRAQFMYYLIMVWYFLIVLASFIIMVHKCRISSVKKRVWIPVAGELIPVALCIIYFLNGSSSPQIGGIGLYNIQEVYMLVFIGFWETCIAIGLIPSRSLTKEREWIREGILDKVGDKINRIKNILDGMWNCKEETFRENLIRICCLGAYIKRRANMELVSDADGYLDTMELSYAIRETFEYIPFYGITVGYEDTGNAKVPAVLITTAYDLLERIVENTESACYVRVYTSPTEKSINFKMIAEADIKNPPRTGADIAAFCGKELYSLFDILGAKLQVSETDDTTYLELSTSYSRNKKFLGFEPETTDISGMARFLSIEDEALGAKTVIHDSLGRALLMSKRYLLEPKSVSRDSVLRELGYSLALADGVRKKKGSYSGEVVDICTKQAEDMGIEVSINGTLPKNPDLLMIADTAITVEITNVMRHSTGKSVRVDAFETKNLFILKLRNDGAPREDEYTEKGGLANLRMLTEKAGGKMNVTFEPEFEISIELPKKDN